MDLYNVIVPPSVWDRIDEYICHIEREYGFPETAQSVFERLEQAIFSLDHDPHRGAERKTGKYADAGYLQLFAGNFIIVYRVDDDLNRVHIETVRHMLESF